MINEVLNAYGFDNGKYSIERFGSGLINHTWIINNSEQKFILQRINDSVFTQPENIAENLELIDEYLQHKQSNYFFTAPVKTLNGKGLVCIDGVGYYRAFEFVKGSHSIDVVQNPAQAYEAAKQFGRFTNELSGIDIGKLKITIPSFHNLTLRFEQYHQALQHGNTERIKQSAAIIQKLNSYAYIASEYEKIKQMEAFKLRVTHHDTKISNILFDDTGKGICVIDLDTVMPGYFISDVGDMMRTYLSPVSEEEKDFNKIEIRDDFYKAIVQGYLEEMDKTLTNVEKGYFFYAGTFMIYMQALRFLTDHINNDIYYGAKYPNHNFMRAGNQITLLEKLIEKKTVLTPLSLQKTVFSF
ncbi:MAG: phosphotransferase enzyme family protein [Niabella sp.]